MLVVAVVAEKKQKVHLKKKPVLLSFDEDLLLEARKIFFRRGITLQQFFAFVLHQITLKNPQIDAIMAELNEFMVKEALSSEQEQEILKISAENLYSIFEEEDKKRLP